MSGIEERRLRINGSWIVNWQFSTLANSLTSISNYLYNAVYVLIIVMLLLYNQLNNILQQNKQIAQELMDFKAQEASNFIALMTVLESIEDQIGTEPSENNIEQIIANQTDIINESLDKLTKNQEEIKELSSNISKKLDETFDEILVIAKDHNCETGFCFELSSDEIKALLTSLLTVQTEFSEFMQPVATFITGDLTTILVDYYNPVSIIGGFHTKPKPDNLDGLKTNPDIQEVETSFDTPVPVVLLNHTLETTFMQPVNVNITS